MTHGQLPLCGQPPAIYHFVHWIKTDRIFRKKIMECSILVRSHWTEEIKRSPKDEAYWEHIPTRVLCVLTAQGLIGDGGWIWGKNAQTFLLKCCAWPVTTIERRESSSFLVGFYVHLLNEFMSPVSDSNVCAWGHLDIYPFNKSSVKSQITDQGALQLIRSSKRPYKLGLKWLDAPESSMGTTHGCQLSHRVTGVFQYYQKQAYHKSIIW